MDLTDTLVTRRQYIEAQLALICEVISRDFEHHRHQNIASLSAPETRPAGQAELRYRMASFRVEIGFVPGRDRPASVSWREFEVRCLMTPLGRLYLMIFDRKAAGGGQHWRAAAEGAKMFSLFRLIADHCLHEMAASVPSEVDVATVEDTEICFQVVPHYPLVEPVDVEHYADEPHLVAKVETLEQRRVRLANEMQGG